MIVVIIDYDDILLRKYVYTIIRYTHHAMIKLI